MYKSKYLASLPMWFLLLSICASSAIFVIFRLFDRYQVDKVQAIVVNYFVAAACGFAFVIPHKALFLFPWFWNAFFLGFIFIGLFVIMARVTAEIGISVAAVSNKLSVVIPILFAYFFLKESITALAWIGIGLSVVGTYLALHSKKSGKSSLLPIILFIGSGLLDTFLKFNQSMITSDEEFIWFTGTIFLFAGLFGSIYLLSTRKKPLLSSKNIAWGFVLGIPNFFSILLILQTLAYFNDFSARIFPANNLGVVILSSLLSFFFFGEKRSLINKVGLLLGLFGIALLLISL